MRSLAITVIILMVALANMASAATIHGTIYNLLLEPQKNTIVEVNSLPQQNFIAKDGEYSFSLLKGNYTISAKYIEDGELISTASENISIVNEGDFVLDLILFDFTEEDFDLLNTPEIDIDAEEQQFPWLIVLMAAIAIVLAGIGILFYKKNKPMIKEGHLGEKSVKEELEQVISILKSESGRITQKELHKKLNLSEAKVSLMVAELESLGKVKKIKQGRGNIIILK